MAIALVALRGNIWSALRCPIAMYVHVLVVAVALHQVTAQEMPSLEPQCRARKPPGAPYPALTAPPADTAWRLLRRNGCGRCQTQSVWAGHGRDADGPTTPILLLQSQSRPVAGQDGKWVPAGAIVDTRGACVQMVRPRLSKPRAIKGCNCGAEGDEDLHATAIGEVLKKVR